MFNSANPEYVEANDPHSGLIERLRTAISPDVMHETLQREWRYLNNHGLQLTSCEVVRVHPRDRKSFTIEYDLGLRGRGGETTERIYAELSPDPPGQRRQQIIASLSKSRRGQLPRGSDNDLIAELSGCGLLLRFRGLDERLDSLKLWRDPESAVAVLRPYIATPSQSVKVELLGHRLGKRCIMRASFNDDNRPVSIIVKGYKSRTGLGRDVMSYMQALRRAGLNGASGFRIPEPIAFIAEWNAMLMEDMQGTSLYDLPAEAKLPGMTAAGRMLAALHNCDVAGLALRSAADEIKLLEDWVDLVQTALPEFAAPVANAFDLTKRQLTQCESFEAALLHRDFYDKQILIDGANASLIDFDTLCYGDPALDAGNFIAHVRLTGLQTNTDWQGFESAFLAGYGKDLPSGFEQHLRAYRNAALLRVACLYAFTTRHQALSMPLLAMVR